MPKLPKLPKVTKPKSIPKGDEEVADLVKRAVTGKPHVQAAARASLEALSPALKATAKHLEAEYYTQNLLGAVLKHDEASLSLQVVRGRAQAAEAAYVKAREVGGEAFVAADKELKAANLALGEAQNELHNAQIGMKYHRDRGNEWVAIVGRELHADDLNAFQAAMRETHRPAVNITARLGQALEQREADLVAAMAALRDKQAADQALAVARTSGNNAATAAAQAEATRTAREFERAQDAVIASSASARRINHWAINAQTVREAGGKGAVETVKTVLPKTSNEAVYMAAIFGEERKELEALIQVRDQMEEALKASERALEHAQAMKSGVETAEQRVADATKAFDTARGRYDVFYNNHRGRRNRLEEWLTEARTTPGLDKEVFKPVNNVLIGAERADLHYNFARITRTINRFNQEIREARTGVSKATQALGIARDKLRYAERNRSGVEAAAAGLREAQKAHKAAHTQLSNLQKGLRNWEGKLDGLKLEIASLERQSMAGVAVASMNHDSDTDIAGQPTFLEPMVLLEERGVNNPFLAIALNRRKEAYIAWDEANHVATMAINRAEELRTVFASHSSDASKGIAYEKAKAEADIARKGLDLARDSYASTKSNYEAIASRKGGVDKEIGDDIWKRIKGDIKALSSIDETKTFPHEAVEFVATGSQMVQLEAEDLLKEVGIKNSEIAMALAGRKEAWITLNETRSANTTALKQLDGARIAFEANAGDTEKSAVYEAAKLQYHTTSQRLTEVEAAYNQVNDAFKEACQRVEIGPDEAGVIWKRAIGQYYFPEELAVALDVKNRAFAVWEKAGALAKGAENYLIHVTKKGFPNDVIAVAQNEYRMATIAEATSQEKLSSDTGALSSHV